MSSRVCFPADFNEKKAYYADLSLLISTSKVLFAGSCAIKTASMQDMS